MATSSMVEDYSQLNTIPAIVGFAALFAFGVQFLEWQIDLGIIPYSFPSAHALLIGLGTLVVAFASSDTKDWQYYETHEQALVLIAVGLMVAAEYVTYVSDLMAEYQPYAGFLAFALGMTAWGVLSR